MVDSARKMQLTHTSMEQIKNLHNKNLGRVHNYPNCEFNLEMYLNPDPSNANRRI